MAHAHGPRKMVIKFDRYFTLSYHVSMKKTDLAKAIVAYSFRNTCIEEIHAGICPESSTGDFSDVFVVDAKGNKIPWNKVSHISQEDMRELMRTAVNRVYAVLLHDGDSEFEELVLSYALQFTRGWDEPKTERWGMPANE